MTASFDIWKALGGIAIFLLGMKLLEEALQQIAGRPFKLFLKKQTSSKPKAIIGGAVVTAVLQSSSVVNLMVLAFVGANLIPIQNALAVILGANAGTTISSWMVATIGFNFNIENFALPIAGLAGISMSLSNKAGKWHQVSKFLFGFGLLFIGLSYIKTGIENAVKQIDLAAFNHYPVIIFLLLGFFITSLIQSSSATMAILLSALYVHAIDLYAATAMALGSEIGTSIKLVLAATKGIPAKKRVAFGNFLFNISTSLLVLIFLLPINRFITEGLGIKDNLIALVFFQTLVNVSGILLFYPFLNVFGRFLEKRFIANIDETQFIHLVNSKDTTQAMNALENEVRHFILLSIQFARDVFERPDDQRLRVQLATNNSESNVLHQYDRLKFLHGELHEFAVQVPNSIGIDDAAVSLRLQQLIEAVRNNMYAAKSLKDALPDIDQLRNSSNDVKYMFYKQVALQTDIFCKRLATILLDENRTAGFNDLTDQFKKIKTDYTQVLQQLFTTNVQNQLSEIEISTLINFNREMYTAYKSFVFALKDYLLDARQADSFEELPGIIR